MYTLKSIARRGSMLGFAVAIVAAAVLPAVSAYAQSALNPLTQRSLLLTSSAPGFQDSDGSNYSNDDPNPIGENYAPAGSGPNGRKTGETFTFRVSTTGIVKAFTLQYCTLAAGKCRAPGNNQGSALTADREVNEGAANAHYNKRSDFDVVGDFTQGAAAGQFQVLVDGNPAPGTWILEKANEESQDWTGAGGQPGLTGKNNYITIKSTTGVNLAYAAGVGQKVEIVFKPSEDIYITNPGDKAFFVKINTYDSDTSQIGPHNDPTPDVTTDQTVIDGGVTVANVMTDSIHITTKVLETMAFSVGTQNRDLTTLTNPATHGNCDPIQTVNGNQLQLGNEEAEYSLETGRAYDVYSYWRLSSNSSGGATVYYSGNTLANTVGDEIAEIGETALNSTPGTEQFGLAFVDATTDDAGKFDPAFEALVTAQPERFKMPTLELDTGIFLQPETNYANGAGGIQAADAVKASFAFEKESNTIPRVIAKNNAMVISCATAKMRYVANIGADTPAGVYTTKINYLAAPQY